MMSIVMSLALPIVHSIGSEGYVLHPCFAPSELCRAGRGHGAESGKYRETGFAARKIAEERYRLNLQAQRYRALFEELTSEASDIGRVNEGNV